MAQAETLAWRPRNETSEDLQIEQSIAASLHRSFGYEVIKLSESLYQIDWAITHEEGGPIATYAEFKRRSKRYATLLLSASKYWKLLDLARLSGARSGVFILWPEGLFWARVDLQAPLEAFIGGNDRGQNGDIEPVVYIPSEWFVPVKL